MKKTLLLVGIVTVIFVAGVWWSKSLQQKDPNLIATNGIHWHPELEIYVKDEKLEIPKGLGLVGTHSPIHTHEDLPVMHLEFEGRVTREDIKFKRFFEVWGKDINEFGETVTMTVNGEENTELGEYEMGENDTIVLRYQ